MWCHHAILLLLPLQSLVQVVSADLCIDEPLLRVAAFDDQRVTQDVVWSRTNQHMAECMFACHQDDNCQSVQYSTTIGLCEALYGKYEGATATSVGDPGIRVYDTTKSPPAMCNLCEAPSCVNGVCTCGIGYNLFGPHCRRLTDCTVFDDDYKKYVGHAIPDNDLESFGFTNSDQCKVKCTADSRCVNFEHNEFLGLCYLQGVHWWSEGVTRSYSFSADHYQRGCVKWQDI